MGNQHSTSANFKPRKNVHWKSAGRPAVPGKPEIVPLLSDDEPNAVTLRWLPPVHDGGAPLHGYQVECNRLGSPAWIRTAPPVVERPELVLTGLEPPHRYQFRVAAINGVGRSDYSELSDVLTVSSERGTQDAPLFLQHLDDITALENDKTEFRVSFSGAPTPIIAWYKDGYEIFSSRRTAITTNDTSSVLVFHQTLPSDEGEIKCTATNRAGHAVTKARLSLEAAPKLRYPRQYEDGLLYEINETIFLKTSIVGKPSPTIDWRHNGQLIIPNDRVELTNTPKFSMLKIHSARRSDRGEYQIHASNNIGEDMAAFLVTVTAPPDPPQRVSVTRQVDKSITLDWEPPADDGGCRIGNYVVEYYRNGWNVWLKATTSRKTNITLFDLIEGSEYRFRVKAESPYGMSAPSTESSSVRIPGKPVDLEFLAVESKIINEVMKNEDADRTPVSPAPRRKRMTPVSKEEPSPKTKRTSPIRDNRMTGSSEMLSVRYRDADKSSEDQTEKRKSFQLDLEDALSPPPISLSAPELSLQPIQPFKPLRNSVSSTELLHERAMARFYKAVAMKEEQTANKERESKYEVDTPQNNHIPLNNVKIIEESRTTIETCAAKPIIDYKTPEIFIKSDSIEGKEFKYSSRQASQDSEPSEGKWQNMSFEEDYTASTVSSGGEESDNGSLNEEIDRQSEYSNEENIYNPRGKPVRSPTKDMEDYYQNEVTKPIPLPDPNFVPKPILKRREPDKLEVKEDKPKKEEKLTIFKKFTKIPVQKPFTFPKILNKTENAKTVEKCDNSITTTLHKSPAKETTKSNALESDEGRIVIEHYGNLVKEYGSHKKPATPLLLNTEDLKHVAEKQQKENKKIPKQKLAIVANNVTKSNKTKQTKAVANSIPKPKKDIKAKEDNANKAVSKSVNKQVNSVSLSKNVSEKCSQQIILKKTERATIVIPIDYQELEKQAKVTVRSAIDYMVDICILLFAFWLYFFKDERLAIPFLILIIYRQLKETVLFNIPQWINQYTPNWLKSKKS